MELNEKLVALRKKKGLTQEELAEAIKVSRQAISRWEIGTALPSADNLKCLSKFYQVSIDEMMGIAFDERQPDKKKTKFSKDIAVILCAIALFLSLVTLIASSVFKNQENTELPVNIGEIDSKDVSGLKQEEGKLGEE